MIKISNLKKVYTSRGNEVHALEDVNLHISPGEIFGIIGLSGAGKSTLVRCINLLERPTAGAVTVDGKDMTCLSPMELRKTREKIGMIFQQFNLLWSRTVSENIAFPLEISGVPKNLREKKVSELLSLVGLIEKKDNYPSQLSGGQKQRVGIARALANDPHVLLCDEATSALDPETTKSILMLLKDINKKLNLTIVLITHEMHVIKEICDSVAVLDSGVIVEQGPVLNIFTNPKTATARRFINSIVNTEIPSVIKDRKAQLLHQGQHGTVIRVSFIGEAAGEPLISSVVQKFGVQANILYGNIDHIKDTLFGSLTLEILPGSGGNIDAAVDYLKSRNLKVEVLD